MPVLRTRFPSVTPDPQLPEETGPRVLCKQDCRMKRHMILDPLVSLKRLRGLALSIGYTAEWLLNPQKLNFLSHQIALILSPSPSCLLHLSLSLSLFVAIPLSRAFEHSGP